MYKAIIVDDELDVCEGLQLLIDWREYGFQIVGEASSGVQALQKMTEWQPDFVVTDIRMPQLDGLQYIRKLKRLFPHVAVVVISAYGEFQYARQAIQLGVMDFLLKPISKQTLEKCLEKVKGHLDEQRMLHKMERLQNQFIQEKWLYDLCHGKLVNPNDLKSVGEMLHHVEHHMFQIVLIEMDDYERYVHECTESEIDLKRFMIRNISEEIAEKYGVPQLFEDAEERMGLLLRYSHLQDQQFKRMAKEIRESLSSFVKISVSIGAGSSYTGWHSIMRSYEEAVQALEYTLFEGKEAFIHYGYLHRLLQENNQFSSTEPRSWNVQPILQAIDESEQINMNKELEQFFNWIKSRETTPEIVRGICLELIMGMVRLVRDHDGDARKLFGERLQEYEQVFMKRSLPTLCEWLSDLSHRTARYLRLLRSEKVPDVMNEVKQWVDEHYAEDISLKMISTQVFKNPVYLGQLFKATFGISFSQYVTKLRIEKAKELLRRDQLRVYEIAEKVGYMTLDTFYQRFKQITGMNPTEYKNKVLR